MAENGTTLSRLLKANAPGAGSNDLKAVEKAAGLPTGGPGATSASSSPDSLPGGGIGSNRSFPTPVREVLGTVSKIEVPL